MQPICTCTIGVQSRKPSHAYPVIRLPREFLQSVVNPALEEAKSMFEKRKMYVTLDLNPSSRHQVFPYTSRMVIREPNTDFKYTIRVDQAGDSFDARAWISFTSPKTNKAEQKERNLPASGISKDDILEDIVHAYVAVNS
jgi:hypothetical protein